MIPANLELTLAPTMELAAAVATQVCIIRMILIPIVFLINLIVNEVNVYTFRSLRLSSILQ